MKQTFIVALLLLFFSSCQIVESNNHSGNKTQNSFSVFSFNEDTGRYELSPEITRSGTSDIDLQSMLRENALLDSLTEDVLSKGGNIKILHVNMLPVNEWLSGGGRAFDDSISIDDPIGIVDTSEVSLPVVSGVLLNGGYHAHSVSLDDGESYGANVSGICYWSATYPIIALNYSVFHNLYVNIGNNNVAAFTGTSSSLSSGALVLSGYLDDIGDSVIVGYNNSDIDQNKIRSCLYNISYVLL